MPAYRWSYYLTCPWELVDEWCRAIKYGVRNLIQWPPVVWGDRHYSSWFLFHVLRHKFIHMEKELRRNPYYIGVEKDMHKMHTCVLLLDRYLADDYTLHCDGQHEKKWGKLRSFWEPCYDEETDDIDPEYCRSFSEWPNALTPELEAKAMKESIDCSKHGCMLMGEDVQLLLKIFSKNYRCW